MAANPLSGPQLAAIGQVQRFLADVATGTVVPTPASVSAAVAQLIAGVGIPLPNMPVPQLPGGLPGLPGFPFAMPAIPGLDPCKFIKCLAASIDCPGATGPAPGAGGDDPVATLVGAGLDAFNRARAWAEDKAREAERRAADLRAAEKEAAGAVRKEIQAAREEAEKEASDMKARGEQLGATVGSAIARTWSGR